MNFIRKSVLAMWAVGIMGPWGWAGSLSPELIVRRCEVIGVGTLEAVADAWNTVPLQAWYPHMKDSEEYLVIGLAKFHLTEVLKGGANLQKGFIRAAFPVQGFKANSTKRSRFTMNDFRTLTAREIGKKALWCFQWDDAAQAYVVRFDYQQQSSENAKAFKTLINAREWTIPTRPQPAFASEAILEGLVKSVDASTRTVTLQPGQPTAPKAEAQEAQTLVLPEWFGGSGSDQLAITDLQAGDGLRIVRQSATATIDDVQLLAGKPYEALNTVFNDKKAPAPKNQIDEDELEGMVDAQESGAAGK